MTDRLTQLQVCLDQLVAQFNATINYVNTQSELAPLDADEKSVINIAANAPLPGAKEQENSETNSAPSGANAGQQAPFEDVLNELSTDIILKSRQISMIIDSLPGIGTLPETQLKIIGDLVAELERADAERVARIKEKDELLKWCEDLIVEVSGGIYRTRT